MTEVTAMAWVPTTLLLEFINPFLDHYELVEGDFENARGSYVRRYSHGLAAHMLSGARVRHSVHRAREMRAMCQASADGRILISAVDLRLMQQLDPAEIDQEIVNFRINAARDEKEAREFSHVFEEQRRRKARRTRVIAVVLGAISLALIAVASISLKGGM